MRRHAPVALQAIVTDLDGTLLNAAGEMTRRTVAALASAAAAGLEVIIATGRPMGSVMRWARASGWAGWVITDNGGQVVDVERETVIYRLPLAGATWRTAVAAIRSAVPGACFAIAGDWSVHAEPQYGRLFPSEEHQPIPSVEAMPGPVFRLLVGHADMGGDELLRVVSPRLPPGVTGSSWSTGPILLSDSVVDKGSTLAWLCVDRGYDLQSIVAFGDWLNDLSMLRRVGWSVGMSNAHPAVLAVVHEVAPPHHEDGVARVLERLLLR